MEHPKYKIALIVGAGEGLSASLARLLSAQGIRVALAARKIEKLGALCSQTGAKAYACNATEPEEVERLFGLVEREIGTPDLVVFNAKITIIVSKAYVRSLFLFHIFRRKQSIFKLKIK